MFEDLASLWGICCETPEILEAQRLVDSELVITTAIANRIVNHAEPDTICCSDLVRDGVEGVVQFRPEWSDQFGNVDLVIIGDNLATIFEVKFATRNENVGGTAAHDTFWLYIYDLIVTWLQKSENEGRVSYCLAVVESSEFLHSYTEREPEFQGFDEEFPSVWAQAFSVGEGQQSAELTLSPSLARRSAGRGIRQPARFELPESLTRKHISRALTGAMNSKLLGLFLRGDSSIRIEYDFYSQQVGDYHVMVLCEITDVVVIDEFGEEHADVNSVLHFLP